MRVSRKKGGHIFVRTFMPRILKEIRRCGSQCFQTSVLLSVIPGRSVNALQWPRVGQKFIKRNIHEPHGDIHGDG